MHGTIGDFILDLVENSVEAGSSFIEVEIGEAEDGVHVRVADDGCGMNSEERERALDSLKTAVQNTQEGRLDSAFRSSSRLWSRRADHSACNPKREGAQKCVSSSPH